ncbi:hypothetical protein RQP46_000799 [Phenoliferia psychrophenolica]
MLATASSREHATTLLAGLQKFCVDSRGILEGIIGGPGTVSKTQFEAKKGELSTDLAVVKGNMKGVVAAQADQACAAVTEAQKHAEDLTLSYFDEVGKYRYNTFGAFLRRKGAFRLKGADVNWTVDIQRVEDAVVNFLQLEGLLTQPDRERALDADIKVNAPGLFKEHAATSSTAFRQAAKSMDKAVSKFLKRFEGRLTAKYSAIIEKRERANASDVADAKKLKKALKTFLDKIESLKDPLESPSGSGGSIKVTAADSEPSRSSARIAASNMEMD